MNKLDKQYQQLLSDIIEFGVEKEDRTGTGTRSIFGYTIRHNMQEGFPALTTKKLAFKTMVTELLWFLRGDTNIKYLVDNGCNIWNGDAYKKYKETTKNPVSIMSFIDTIKNDSLRAKKWGELGPIYGKQWIRWEHYNEIGQHYSSKTQKIEESDISRREPINQIQNLINELKTNPDSRRLMVSAWNVGELDQMVLPPCHYGFQCYTKEMTFGERALYWTSSIGKDISYASKLDESDLDEKNVPNRKLSLMWNQRESTFSRYILRITIQYSILWVVIRNHSKRS